MYLPKVLNGVGVTTPSIVLVNCWTKVVTVTCDSVKTALCVAKEKHQTEAINKKSEREF